jgi:hypothetical protein
MKEIVKEVLDEMMKFHNKVSIPHNHLKKAFEEMESPGFSLSTRSILQWLKEVSLGWESIDKYEIHPLQEKRYSNLLSLAPALNELFTLDSGHIIWNDSVTDEEKVEIRDYINKNHKIVTRIRMRKRG